MVECVTMVEQEKGGMPAGKKGQNTLTVLGVFENRVAIAKKEYLRRKAFPDFRDEAAKRVIFEKNRLGAARFVLSSVGVDDLPVVSVEEFNALKEKVAAARDNEAELVVTRRELLATQRSLVKVDEHNQILERQLEGLRATRADMGNLRTELTTVREARDILRTQLEEKNRAARSTTELEGQVTEAQTEFLNLREQLADADIELTDLKADLRSTVKKLGNTRRSLTHTKKYVGELSATNAGLRRDLAEARTEASDLHSDLSKTQQERDSYKEQVERLQVALAKKTAELIAERERHDSVTVSTDEEPVVIYDSSELTPEEKRIALGAAVRTLRQNRGITSDEVAKKIGMTKKMLLAAESGDRVIPRKNMVRILEIDELHEGEGVREAVASLQRLIAGKLPSVMITASDLAEYIKVLQQHPSFSSRDLARYADCSAGTIMRAIDGISHLSVKSLRGIVSGTSEKIQETDRAYALIRDSVSAPEEEQPRTIGSAILTLRQRKGLLQEALGNQNLISKTERGLRTITDPEELAGILVIVGDESEESVYLRRELEDMRLGKRLSSVAVHAISNAGGISKPTVIRILEGQTVTPRSLENFLATVRSLGVRESDLATIQARLDAIRAV